MILQREDQMRKNWKKYARYKTQALSLDLATDHGRLLNSGEAAGYLGVSVATVWRWTKTGRLSRIQFANKSVRYLMSDLDEAILKNRHACMVWNQDSEELPLKAAMKLLSCEQTEIYKFRSAGTLKDLKYASVVKFLERRFRRKVVAAIRKECRVRYASKMTCLYRLIRQYKKKAGEEINPMGWHLRKAEGAEGSKRNHEMIAT